HSRIVLATLFECANGFLDLQIGNSPFINEDKRKLLQQIEIPTNFKQETISQRCGQLDERLQRQNDAVRIRRQLRREFAKADTPVAATEIYEVAAVRVNNHRVPIRFILKQPRQWESRATPLGRNQRYVRQRHS